MDPRRAAGNKSCPRQYHTARGARDEQWRAVALERGVCGASLANLAQFISAAFIVGREPSTGAREQGGARRAAERGAECGAEC